MSKEIKLEKQEEKQKVLKAEIPFTEIIQGMSDEDLTAKFDEDTAALPDKKWTIDFNDKDIKFIVHLLNTIPFKAMQAYVLVGLRNQIGEQKGQLELDSSAVEALWHVLINDYEGKGIKEAMKYIAVADKLAPIVRSYQQMNAKIKEMGAELHKREMEKQQKAMEAQQQKDAEKIVEVETKPKKRGRKKKTDVVEEVKND